MSIQFNEKGNRNMETTEILWMTHTDPIAAVQTISRSINKMSQLSSEYSVHNLSTIASKKFLMIMKSNVSITSSEYLG
jgi:hypothetical protein